MFRGHGRGQTENRAVTDRGRDAAAAACKLASWLKPLPPGTGLTSTVRVKPCDTSVHQTR